MLERLSIETLETIFDTLPIDLTFADETDIVRYYNRGDDRIFKRTPAVIGRKVQDCHPKQSLRRVNEVISDLKSGKRDVAEFWVDFEGSKICNRYFSVRDKTGRYLGILEVNQDITEIQKIIDEKRLLDEE